MIDAAIVGLGRWGRSFVEAGSDRLRFTRAVEPALEGARDFAGRHGLALGTDLAAVLADPRVDAVVLATPHSLHPEQVLACAGAGKPVFCEKPLALGVAEARRMIEACRSAGVPLAVGHNRRFWPSMGELRRLVAAGALGQVLHVEGHNSNENAGAVRDGWRLSPAESPGGGMTGAGLHVLDALVSVMGPARRVQARMISHKAAPAPIDTVSVLVEFAIRRERTDGDRPGHAVLLADPRVRNARLGRGPGGHPDDHPPERGRAGDGHASARRFPSGGDERLRGSRRAGRALSDLRARDAGHDRRVRSRARLDPDGRACCLR